jgi:hypothetical protein
MGGAWGVRGPAKFDTYNHLRMGVSRLAVCTPSLRECGSLSGLERQTVSTRYLKCRLARHLGSFFSLPRIRSLLMGRHCFRLPRHFSITTLTEGKDV